MPTSRASGTTVYRSGPGGLPTIVPPRRGLVELYTARALARVQRIGDSLRDALIARLRDGVNELLGIRSHCRGGYRPPYHSQADPGRRPPRRRFDNPGLRR